MNPVVEQVTARIRERSRQGRADYLAAMAQTREENPPKKRLSCGNLAHGYAACGEQDKQTIRLMNSANLGIVTSYNDMLSAHQPLLDYPEQIKAVAREVGSSAQVAGGVPAMCDGVTQGQPGMELSLFSRDVVAMATAVGLSHNLFDGVLCLGVCDKIVPGMIIGALQFGHLPTVFVPAGPMPSGIPNKEKAAVRQRFAEGKASREELLEAESASYHSPGTCTFYGTANSNQVLMEMLGVQLPGSSFVNPEDPMRAALTRESVLKVIAAADPASGIRPLCETVTEESLVNAVVALLATGGSTNHTLHLVAIAAAAGIDLRWQDFDDLSRAVPLLARVYPNGEADINAFQRAGGMAFLVRELRSAGLLNENVHSLMGEGLDSFELAPQLTDDGRIAWQHNVLESRLPEVLTGVAEPFDQEGGLRVLQGNLGESVIKVSAVKPEHRVVSAPCRIFHAQDDIKTAFDAGELDRDVIAVVRFQGPKANGMPELHKLTPYLGLLQDRGYQVALVTDGRMSGASGKVPAAIHLSPEAVDQGPISRLRDGDLITLDAEQGILNVNLSDQELAQREPATAPRDTQNLGRNLFANFRQAVGGASSGASSLDP
ncbi:phosphogluconate dehydratase [Porticoccus sp. W117]|uniref:phosphogluconate dehydratase n=1 Tax=Porticoccus sp. W117 TaxID=3054777 RepID=UPI0025915027|nr:phosphogluconate dehydratase [Porticoccus sp. W117]MDM3870044.1 phosphogluconate dehydratase [Porticoccus sp. W117]